MTEEPKKNKAGKRRRRELILIFVLLVGIGLLFFFQTHVSQLGDKIPVTSNILVISLIGINLLLFLLLVFLILRNIVKLGASVEDAVRMLTFNPAKLLGIENKKGTLRANADADLVLLDENLQVTQVYARGLPV